MQFSDLLEQYDDDTSASEEQQTAARPRTAHAASNATSAAARPQSAFRPQPARAGELSSDRKPTTWLPAGKKSLSRNPISQRPATAGAKGPISKHATLAQLKAELAAVAAGGNMQLQSLSPRTVPIDASAELQAQVGQQAHFEACQCCTNTHGGVVLAVCISIWKIRLHQVCCSSCYVCTMYPAHVQHDMQCSDACAGTGTACKPGRQHDIQPSKGCSSRGATVSAQPSTCHPRLAKGSRRVLSMEPDSPFAPAQQQR